MFSIVYILKYFGCGLEERLQFIKKKKKVKLTDCVYLILPSGALQATRALMIVSIIVTLAGLGVACMGMKCTNCGGDDKTRKSRIAMTGGIIILVGGEKICFFVCFCF